MVNTPFMGFKKDILNLIVSAFSPEAEVPSMSLAVRDVQVGPFWQQEDIGNCGEVVSRRG